MSLIFFGIHVHAQEEVELPPEELSKESVSARFDNTVTVRSRNIRLAGKFETGAYFGWNFNEAIANQGQYGLNLGYHWSETSSLILNYSFLAPGLNTQYSSALNAQGLDFTRAPAPQSAAWLNYEWDIFYGKISLTKQWVTNISIYPLGGLGMTTYSNKSYYGLDGGLGGKFYFNPTWAIRLDFKLQYSGQPSPFQANILKTLPAPSPNAFNDQYSFGVILDVGLVAVF